MNLLRVLLRSVCGSHPSDVPPKSKISVQIEQNGNGRRSGAFLHISFKNSSICKAFGVRQRPPQGAEFVCVPCGANNSKSVGSNTVRVRPPPSAPKSVTPLIEWGYTFCVLVGGRTRNLRVVHGCKMAVAQSRRKDAPTPTTAIRQPRYTFARSTSGVLFLVLGEGEPATCG